MKHSPTKAYIRREAGRIVYALIVVNKPTVFSLSRVPISRLSADGTWNTYAPSDKWEFSSSDLVAENTKPRLTIDYTSE